MKKTTIILYIFIIATMAAATIIEHYHGSSFVSRHIYGSWWFSAAWAVMVALAAAWIVRRKVRLPSVLTLHLSFAVILAGALLTHLSAEEGTLHLRQGVTADRYSRQTDTGNTVETEMPFSVRLDSFRIQYHEGTTAVADYLTYFTVTDRQGGHKTAASVSMNNIFCYGHTRFCQAGYDSDMLGSRLSVSRDPYGITVSYTGYALLLISFLWMLADPKGSYRRIVRMLTQKRSRLAAAALFLTVMPAYAAPHTLPKDVADRFGRLLILHNDRICPLNTFAVDFTKKIYGKASYKGLTPEQVVTGWIFWGDEWSDEPFIRIKGGEMRETLALPGHVSLNRFFNRDMGGYVIGPYVQEYLWGQHDEFHRQIADTDERVRLIMELRRGTLLKMFPLADGGKVTWHSPTSAIPDTAPHDRKLYIQNVFSLLYTHAKAGEYARMNDIISKTSRFQQKNGGGSLPSLMQTRAEMIYNKVPFATILFMLNLSVGLVTMILAIRRLCSDTAYCHRHNRTDRVTFALTAATAATSFAALTACLALRWVISGTAPMSDGYETMLLAAWLVMLLCLMFCRRIPFLLPCGLLSSGMFLLVSHINSMDPQISHIMPVLNSPLLCIHVSVIMTGFAMLSLTFVCGVTAIILHLTRRGSQHQEHMLRLMSQLFLYPALAALAIGIFTGAVWAGVSWGRYWSWDPKEVWALITLMVYAIAVHSGSMQWLRSPMRYHIFITAAFLCIIMTYFGVNYFLGGMHSYA